MSRLEGLKGGFASIKENFPSKAEEVQQELERVSALVPGHSWELDQWGNLFCPKEQFRGEILDTPKEVYLERGTGLGTDLHLISGYGLGYAIKGIVKEKVFSKMIQPWKTTFVVVDPGRATCSCGRVDCEEGASTGEAKIQDTDGNVWFINYMEELGDSPYSKGEIIFLTEEELERLRPAE